MRHVERTWGAVSFVIVACGTLAVGPTRADPPKPEAKPARAAQPDYLPLLLQKAAFQNEREYADTLTRSHQIFEALRESGAVSSLHADQVEQELLQTRVRVVQREVDLRDAIDQFKRRFDLTAEGLRKAEEVALDPLAGHLRRFDDVFRDYDAARTELSKGAPPQDAAKLRPLVRRVLTGSALVKETRLGKQLAAQLDEWEKGKDLDGALRKYRDERARLLDRRTELRAQEKPIPPADAQRLEEVALQIDLADLERSLRAYEEQFGNGNNGGNVQRRHAAFREVAAAAGGVLHWAVPDRLAQLRRSWPAPAPVRLTGVDVLACDADKAEQVVESLSKNPDGAVAGKARVRKVRALAETYRLQQRLFEISHLRARVEMDTLVASSELVPVQLPAGAAELTRQLLGAQRTLGEVKGQLVGTWIGYQTARFDLYRDLGLTPP